MVEINWTLITYLLVGLFALAGFYKGWWKESVTTIFLTILIFFLLLPQAAQAFISFINFIIALLWGLLSESLRLIFGNLLESGLGVEAGEGAPLLNSGDGQTWLIILIIFLALAILISRSSMPNIARLGTAYAATWSGSLMGAILGGVNGWLIINLVHAYLLGSGLPGGGDVPGRTTSNNVVIEAVEVPTTTITDSFLPWFFIILALLLFIVVALNRVRVPVQKGYWKVDRLAPIGYDKVEIEAK